MVKKIFVAHANPDFKLPEGFSAFTYCGSDEHKEAIIAGILANQYTKVAELEVDSDDVDDALELAFDHTNHVFFNNLSWLDGDKVTMRCVDSARSTSIGDIVCCDGKMFVVAKFGYHELDLCGYIEKKYNIKCK